MSLRDAPTCVDWPVPVGDYLSWDNPMRVWQAGRCAFCGYEDRLVRDHDHESGLMRGLLCTGCNTSEPFQWYDRAWMIYREGANPAAILGIREVFQPHTLTIMEQSRAKWLAKNPDYQRELAWDML